MTVLSSLFSKLIRSEPVAPSRREQVEESLVGDLKAELVARKPYVDPETSDVVIGYSSQLRSYSTGTLELAHAAFHNSGKLTHAIECTDDEEGNFRAVVNFWNATEHTYIAGRLLQHVRESTDTADLGAVAHGSLEYVHIAAVLRLAMKCQSTRYVESIWSDPELYGEDEQKQLDQMTPGIAQIVGEYPDRIHDITDYIIDRYKGLLEKVDTAELRLFLDTPSQALSKGML
jgi:hypothetical protein